MSPLTWASGFSLCLSSPVLYHSTESFPVTPTWLLEPDFQFGSIRPSRVSAPGRPPSAIVILLFCNCPIVERSCSHPCIDIAASEPGSFPPCVRAANRPCGDGCRCHTSLYSGNSCLVRRNNTWITNYTTFVLSMARCGTPYPCFYGAISLTVDCRMDQALHLRHQTGVNSESLTITTTL